VREKHPVDFASGGQRTARPTSDRVLTKQNPTGKCVGHRPGPTVPAPQQGGCDGARPSGAQFQMCQMPAGLEGRVQPRLILDDVEVVPPVSGLLRRRRSRKGKVRCAVHLPAGVGRADPAFFGL